MRTLQPILLAIATAILLTACGGSGKVRVTEGSEQIAASPTGTLFVTNDATIVHVNPQERIATIRNANRFEAGTFLIVKNSEGTQTGILKALPVRETGLRTADILEGLPSINNTVTAAGKKESARLAKIYRDAEE